MTHLRLLVSSTLLMACLSVHAQLRYSGSDTVEPVVEAARMAFARRSTPLKLDISSVGSAVGIRELCENKTAMAGSSRPMRDEEARDCDKNGVAYTEVPVAIDAVVLIVSARNTVVRELKLSELKRLFEPASADKLVSWRNLRPDFPEQPLRTVGVNVKHGTFDFFHNAIGNKRLVRMDYKDTANHEDTARIVAADAGAIGFVPLSVARDMAAQVRAVAIDFGQGPVEPSQKNVLDGRYTALSRLVYLYVNGPAVAKAGPHAEMFVSELLGGLDKYVSFANLTPLSSLQYQESMRRVKFRR